MTQIALIANGLIEDCPLIRERILTYPKIIAVDGGLNHCIAMNITPNLIIGDFDSAEKQHLSEMSSIPTMLFPADKDETDLELAIREALKSNPEKITVFGATGLRTDHTLGNLYLTELAPKRIYLETERELIWTIEGETLIETFPGQTLSLIPLGFPAKGVTTQGLKWNMDNATLNKNFISISNVSLDSTVKVTIAEGSVLCVLSCT
jgi:thiamine pyrophosphokinase